MNEHEFKDRTKQLALEIINITAVLPQKPAADVIGRQLLRSATSIGANYRAACRAKSRADLIAKLGIVEEEADETCYWLEILVEAKLLPKAYVAEAMREANEIVAMTVASLKTLRAHQIQNPKSKI